MGSGSLDSLTYQGAQTVYEMAKYAYQKGKNAVKTFTAKKPSAVPKSNQNNRTQDLKAAQQPKISNKEYKEKMDKEYGSGFYGFVNGIFGGKI